MPIYEFKCQECGHVVTLLQKYDDPPPPCPKEGCEGKTEKKLSASSFHLKGDGFYKTDYGV